MGREMLSLCDSLADGSREHQAVGLVPEDSSHRAKVSWGNLLAPKKPWGILATSAAAKVELDIFHCSLV